MKLNKDTHKILMTSDTVGGIWHYCLNLGRALQKSGVEVHLATMGPLPSNEQRAEAESISNLVLHESSYQLEWMPEPWDEIEQAGMWLLYLEQEIKPDLIHLNNYVFGELPWDSPCLVVGHSCVTFWWEDVRKEPLPPSWHTYYRRVKKGLQAADHVVGVSRGMLNRLHRHYGPFRSSSLIYNGVSSTILHQQEKEHYFFSIGRYWDEAKNLPFLQKAAPKLPWPLKLAGESSIGQGGSYLDGLGKLNRQQINQQLSGAIGYISPSFYEPLGLATLEAATQGCILLLSDIDTHHEIWGDAALYFDPESPGSLALQAQRLKTEAGLADSLRKQALEKSRQYSLDNLVQAYLTLYSRLIAEHQQPGTLVN